MTVAALPVPSGMILFDKPEGWTSHDAVEAFRRMMPPGTKVGHCGTLDPLATGLLVLLVGPCTRLQARLQGLGKTYSGTIRLGVATDTGDIMGRVLQSREVREISLCALQAAMDAFRGTLEMPAPAYSAVKYKGKPLYRYARKGIAVPPRPRRSVIYDWSALSYEAPELSFGLSCSSGTYVRSLAEALGGKLGCGAAVSTLRRDKIADLSVKEAVTLEDAKSLSAASLAGMLRDSLPRLQALAGSRSP